MLLAGILIATGCASDAAPSTAGQAFCDGYCRFVKRCGLSADVGGCPDECVQERPGLSDLSVQGAERLGDCIAGFECSVSSDESAWKTSFDACWKSAQVGLTPSAHVRAFCANFAEAWFECGDRYSTSACEGNYGMWSDAMLDEFAACERETDCTALASCVQTTAGGS